MINMNKFIIVDFETTALDNTANQPVSLGAVMIDPRKLTICEQGLFYSLINIIPDDQVEQYGLCKTEQKALDINKLTLEEINHAPPLKKVWSDFADWVKFHTPKNKEWDAPIFCGHNYMYDKVICDRIQNGHLQDKVVLPEKLLAKNKASKLSKEDLASMYKGLTPYKEPWKFGPSWLFHPAIFLDTKLCAFSLFENCREPNSLSLPSIREHLGLPVEGAHNALVDCLYSAEILVRYLALMRKVYLDTDFHTNAETVLPIKEILKEREECPF